MIDHHVLPDESSIGEELVCHLKLKWFVSSDVLLKGSVVEVMPFDECLEHTRSTVTWLPLQKRKQMSSECSDFSVALLVMKRLKYSLCRQLDHKKLIFLVIKLSTKSPIPFIVS